MTMNPWIDAIPPDSLIRPDYVDPAYAEIGDLTAFAFFILFFVLLFLTLDLFVGGE